MPQKSLKLPKKKQILNKLGKAQHLRQPIWTPERMRIRDIILIYYATHGLPRGALSDIVKKHNLNRNQVQAVKELMSSAGAFNAGPKKIN